MRGRKTGTVRSRLAIRCISGSRSSRRRSLRRSSVSFGTPGLREPSQREGKRKRTISMAVENHLSVPSPDGPNATGELVRVLAELQEANARLVIAALQLQELSE